MCVMYVLRVVMSMCFTLPLCKFDCAVVCIMFHLVGCVPSCVVCVLRSFIYVRVGVRICVVIVYC